MLRALMKKSWKKHPTKQQLFGHLPPISKAIQIRRTRHAGHGWRIQGESISDVHFTRTCKCWTTDLNLCTTVLSDTGCSLEDLPEELDDRDEWQEREICDSSMTWLYIYIYIYIKEGLLVNPWAFQSTLVYIYIYVYTRVDWKANGLTKSPSCGQCLSSIWFLVLGFHR